MERGDLDSASAAGQTQRSSTSTRCSTSMGMITRPLQRTFPPGLSLQSRPLSGERGLPLASGAPTTGQTQRPLLSSGASGGNPPSTPQAHPRPRPNASGSPPQRSARLEAEPKRQPRARAPAPPSTRQRQRRAPGKWGRDADTSGLPERSSSSTPWLQSTAATLKPSRSASGHARPRPARPSSGGTRPRVQPWPAHWPPSKPSAGRKVTRTTRKPSREGRVVPTQTETPRRRHPPRETPGSGTALLSAPGTRVASREPLPSGPRTSSSLLPSPPPRPQTRWHAWPCWQTPRPWLPRASFTSPPCPPSSGSPPPRTPLPSPPASSNSSRPQTNNANSSHNNSSPPSLPSSSNPSNPSSPK